MYWHGQCFSANRRDNALPFASFFLQRKKWDLLGRVQKILREQARVTSILKLGSRCSSASEGTGGQSLSSKVSSGVRL